MSDRRHPEPSAPTPNALTSNTPASPTDAPEDAERRAALERLGAMAVWTAPTMLTLLASRRASAQSWSPPAPP